jgi:hypothetical protein
LKERSIKYIVYLLLVSFGWLFANKAMFTHSHLLLNGQVITHAHPYTPDKNSNSPFQSHKHQTSVAFFLDLITNLNVDSFGSLPFFVFLLSILAVIPAVKAVITYQESYTFGADRAPPRLH